MNCNQKGMRILDSKSMKTIEGGFVIEIDSITSCFEETTLIQTKAGPKMIKDLDIASDQVWNPMNQKWMTLSRKTVTLVKGIAYEITTHQGSVVVTGNHPFMLGSNELVQACELMEGDLLANGESGDPILKVTAMVIEEYMIVHNLVFENAKLAVEDHFVQANGIVSGVLFLQDKIQHRTPASRLMETSR